MKFTVAQADLSAALAAVGPAVPARPSHPILANVLVTTEPGTATLSAFDLSLGISVSITAECASTGRAVLPHALLAPLVAKLPSDAALTLEIADGAATISSTSGAYRLAAADPDDYPDLLAPSAKAVVEALPAAELQAALQAVRHAVSRDESKQLLQGVCLAATATAIEAAATDGHRLATYGAPRDSAVPHAIIPARALRLIAGLAGDTITITRDSTVVQFGDATTTITTRTIDGTYPNYRQLIPASFAHEMIATRTTLISALERVAVIADHHNNVVKFTLSPALLTISAEIADVGGGTETLSVDTDANLQIAFNVRYLLDGLKVLHTDQICLRCNAPTTPAIIEPVDSDTLQTILIMPVQVR